MKLSPQNAGKVETSRGAVAVAFSAYLLLLDYHFRCQPQPILTNADKDARPVASITTSLAEVGQMVFSLDWH